MSIFFLFVKKGFWEVMNTGFMATRDWNFILKSGIIVYSVLNGFSFAQYVLRDDAAASVSKRQSLVHSAKKFHIFN